jgi:hypothetical protein
MIFVMRDICHGFWDYKMGIESLDWEGQVIGKD